MSAAIEAHNAGKSLPQVVQAFAAETDNQLDDQMAAELAQWIAQGCEVADQVAQAAIVTAAQLANQTPVQADRLRKLAEQAEYHAPEILRTLHDVADRSETVAQDVEKVAMAVAVGAQQVSLACRGLLRGNDENTDL